MGFVLATTVDDCLNSSNAQYDQCYQILQDTSSDVQKAIDGVQKESAGVQSQLNSAKNQITQAEKIIANLNQQLNNKEAELKTQQKLLSERVKRYYKSSKKFSALMIFLSNTGGTSLLQQYALYQAVISQDKEMITQYTNEVTTLNDEKTKLEATKTKLNKLKSTLETHLNSLAQDIKTAQSYKTKLDQKLKDLEAQRLASLSLPTTTGSGISCVDDRTIDPGFGSGFAFFTFGIPHHVGLNQYGAYGRAKAGQDYKTILNAYYNNVSIENRSNININVIGYGSMSLETYLLGIYEVPESWPLEALKAQAVAARSYALAYTNNGSNSICTTQACQVYKGGNKGGQWEQAVKDTACQVLVQNGNVISAYFASTAGGYTISSADANWSSTGWTKGLRDASGDINSLDDLKAKAYDKDSPCFYSAQGYRKEYNKSAWLKPSEVADIVNAILLSQKDSSVNNNLSPVDQGGWSSDKVKEELKNKGGTVCNNVNSTSQSFDFGSGQTTQISFNCDTGTFSFDGSTFKSYFNARAPANIAIVGRLYNVEKR